MTLSIAIINPINVVFLLLLVIGRASAFFSCMMYVCICISFSAKGVLTTSVGHMTMLTDVFDLHHGTSY